MDVKKALVNGLEVVFDAEEHKYTVNGVEFTSATTFLKEFEEHFDPMIQAQAYAERKGLEADKVVAEWKQRGEEASQFGSQVHAVAEKICIELANGKKLSEICYKSEKEKVNQYAEALIRFFSDHPKLTPKLVEEITILPSHKLAGTIDLVAKTVEGEHILIDWKTNRDLDIQNKFCKFMKHPIPEVPATPYGKYTLQLMLYKRMIQQTHDIYISQLWIVHLQAGTYAKHSIRQFPPGWLNRLLNKRLEKIMQVNKIA